jgi:Tfp pilus assembly protein PilX
MIRTRSLFRNQRGSALLISIVLIMVITILGLALFELGQIEGQHSGVSLGDARAFELAQAGMERAVRELSNAFLADPYGSESWVDGPNRPTCAGVCQTGQYRVMNLVNNTLPASGTDPGGTFTVELKQVLVAEANNPVSQGAAYTYPSGQSCIPSAPVNQTVCANLMFVRSTGTVVGPPGYTAVRTVQALVKAYSTSYFAGGLTAEKAFGASNDPAIDGRVLIAGSINILGTTSISPAFQINGGGAMGMKNNWADLWPDVDLAGLPTLARITPRQAICPTGVDCTGGANLVESLNAELKVYGNVSNSMVQLNGNTDLGINAVQTGAAYGDATINPPNFTAGNRFGKGRIDGVYISNGCSMPCTTKFGFGGTSTIYVDTNNYTKPYPYRPPKLPLNNQLNVSVLYPTASDSTVINGTPYADWWADFMVFNTWAGLNPVLLGAPAQQPAGVALTDAKLDNAGANGGYCGPAYAQGGLLGHTDSFGARFSNAGGIPMMDSALPDFPPMPPPPYLSSINGFCHTFKFVNKAGTIQVGEICWRRGVIGGVAGVPGNTTSPGGNNKLNMYPGYNWAFPGRSVPTLEFGSPSCDVPTNPSNPLLIFHYNPWRIGFTNQSPKDYEYRGSAIIFTRNGGIAIENTLQTACAVSPCTGQRFPEDNLLILINRQGAEVDIANNLSAQPVNRFMGYVFSEGAVKTQYISNLVGSLRAQQFCFNNSTSTSGCGGVTGAGGNPRFYQVSFQDLRKIPEELPASSGDTGNRWLVDIVPRFWIECRRGPGDVLPTTPTGTCQYQ